MISNQFDLYFLCFIAIIIKLKERKIQIKLFRNHFDLKFILTYNIDTNTVKVLFAIWTLQGYTYKTNG